MFGPIRTPVLISHMYNLQSPPFKITETTYALSHVIHKIDGISPPTFDTIVFSRSIS